jgi:2-C-methyl-D-erythritol 4-phosphate cytidylyltransferase/2-C-methyl-D-erythritol 2,4-cyclodiphosphate synthase
MTNVALIVAAGRGQRFGGPLPKQYCTLNGVPVLRYTLHAFLSHPQIDAVRVIIHADDEDHYAQAAAGLGLAPPVHGGATRQDSVRRGLAAIAALDPAHVLIHDAVRPFVAAETITAVLAALADHPGAMPGLPVTDTLKRVEAGRIAATVDRNGLFRAQTPQGFRYAAILDAHAQAAAAGVELTDDAMVAERIGLAVAMVAGTEDNFKITTMQDLGRAEALAAALTIG